MQRWEIIYAFLWGQKEKKHIDGGGRCKEMNGELFSIPSILGGSYKQKSLQIAEEQINKYTLNHSRLSFPTYHPIPIQLERWIKYKPLLPSTFSVSLPSVFFSLFIPIINMVLKHLKIRLLQLKNCIKDQLICKKIKRWKQLQAWFQES